MTLPRAGLATRRLALVVAAALLAGCATSGQPDFPAVAGVREVDLAWRPQPGMRLVHKVSTDVEMSGPLTEAVAEADRKQHVALTRTLEVTDVAPGHFDVRFVQDGWPVPATARLSREWALESVKLDDTSASPGDRGAVDASVRRLVEPLAQAGQFFGPWKVGETRPFDIRLAGFPETSGGGPGTITLSRVVTVDGRRAAEFTWTGRVEFLFTGEPGRGVPGRMTIAGTDWRDLDTGASLRQVAKATAEFTRQGRPTRVEYRTTEVLDSSASQL